MGKRQSTPAVVTISLNNRERIVSKVGFATPVDFDERTQEWSFRGIGNMETDPMGLYRFTALWDTGAERTTVVPKVIRALGLEPLEFGTIIGIDGRASPSPIYFASIGMVTCGGFAFSNVRVFALERDDQLQGIDVLIGMAFMNQGDMALTYDKHGKRWFSFRSPSRKKALKLDSIKKPKRPHSS